MRFPPAFFYGLGVLGLDLWSKQWAQQRLQQRDLDVIAHFFKLSLVHNNGIAFGLLDDPAGGGRVKATLLIAVAIVALVIVAVYALRTPPGARTTQLALGFLMGGILGNMTDRVLHSYVVDFLDFDLYFFKFPTFNLADSGITVGVGLLLLASFQDEKASPVARGGRQQRDRK